MEIAMSLPAAPELAASERPSSRALAQARARLVALAAFHRSRGEVYDQALATNNVGLAFYMEDRNDEAIDGFRHALPLFAQLHELPKQAQVLSNIALAESELGRTAESSRHYDQLLALISAAVSPKIYADALNNKAFDEKVLGHFDNALSLFGRALDIARGLQDKLRESYGLSGIGEVYDLTGDQDQALNYYRQALAIRTREFDSRGRVATLRDIANALRVRGDATGALAMHTEALTLEASASVRVRLNIQIAKDLDALGRSTEALKLVEQVVREPSYDEVGHALALLERGRLRGAAGEAAAAEQDLRRAVDIFHRNELPADEHAAWVVLARTQRHSGAPVEAMRSIDRALALSEEIRLQSANPEQRATLLQPLRPAFDLKISMLAERYLSTSADKSDANRQALATEALTTAEQARARALADFQAFDANLPGVPAGLLQRRRTALQDLATKRNQLEMRLDRGGTNDGLSVSLRAEIASSRRELSEIDAAIGAAAGGRGQKQAHGGATMAGASAQLPRDTAVVEYWLGTERALAWALTSAGITMIDLGSSDDIAAAVKAYHDSLRDMNTATEAQRLALSRRLYTLAVAPLAPSVASKRMLVFAPDGALHYTSFASLVTDAVAPAHFLVQEHDVAVTPSITMLLAKERTPALTDDRRPMLLVADPVYQLDDSRYSQVASGHADAAPPTMAQALQLRGGLKTSDLGRLPATATEAQGIAALWPASQVDRLYGFDATREGFLARHLDRYRYIHMATHGLTDAEIPQLSSLVLSTRDRHGKSIEGRVLAADFMTTTLTADVVVLGACDTALGKSVAGEGLIGLRYVVLARGAKAVVASLWPVPDQASAQLMASFYAQLVRGSRPVASALSGAMRSYIANSGTDPSMWGAFAASTRTLGTSIVITRSGR
jgi:CHAT domain-containing protein